MLAFGSAWRLPRSPAASSSEPIEHAWPMQYVWIGAETYCRAGQCRGARAGGRGRTCICVASAGAGGARARGTHCVVDGHARGDAAAGRVDVEVDRLRAVFGFEEEELRDDQRRAAVADLGAHKRVWAWVHGTGRLTGPQSMTTRSRSSLEKMS